MWDAINDSRTRPAHRAMDGHIAPVDDPIWKRWSPPAGHSCRCTRIALSEAQARARGYPKVDPGVEPDAGWEGDPTEGNEDLVRIIKARQAACLTTFAAKRQRPPGRNIDCTERGADSLRAMQTAQEYGKAMPPPRALSLPLIPMGAGDDAAFKAFMRAMGDELAREVEVSPFPGTVLSVSRQMFTDHKSGRSKADKRGRAPYMNYIAETVMRPDEAWRQRGDFGDETLLLLASFLRGGKLFGVVAAFQKRAGIWEGWTGYNAPRMSYFYSKRSGILEFRRPEA